MKKQKRTLKRCILLINDTILVDDDIVILLVNIQNKFIFIKNKVKWMEKIWENNCWWIERQNRERR